jgi:hypothetical protein
MRAAQHHSQDMAANNFVSHTGSDGSSPWDRIRREGYPLAAGGETIAAGYPGPPSVVAGWKGSPPHWSILMGDYEDIGVGYAFNASSDYDHYWTADLAVPAGSASGAQAGVDDQLRVREQWSVSSPHREVLTKPTLSVTLTTTPRETEVPCRYFRSFLRFFLR